MNREMSTSLTSFEADAPISDILPALKRDGGIIMRNLVAEELMDEVYAEILSNSMSDDLKTQGGELWPEGNKTIGALPALSPTFAEKLLIHPRILEIADGMLLPMIRMSTSDLSDRSHVDADPFARFRDLKKNEAGSEQLIVCAADQEKGPNCHHYNLGASVMLELHSGRKNQVLHREDNIYQPFVGYLPDMREFLVSVMWAGTDFTLDNGATRVVPGSHRWPEHRIATESEICQAVMPKGSAVVWLSRTLHGAGRSTSNEGRTAFFASYVADWVRQEENQYLTVPPEIAAKLSERAQQMIGYQCSDLVGWVKGRSKKNLLQEGKSGNL